MPQADPEVWLRGDIEGYPRLLMPVVHTLLQVREDVHRLVETVPDEHVWTKPGSAATLGFHVRHMAGALDRLFTYARGEMLSTRQKEALAAEGVPGQPAATLAELSRELDRTIARALDQLRATPTDVLLHERLVGRAALPSTVLGLLFHAAEHSTRHVGQAITTARVLRRPASEQMF